MIIYQKEVISIGTLMSAGGKGKAMNRKVSKFIRQQLKEGLSQCTDAQQLLFKRMYSYDNFERSTEEVVDNMPDSKLDWALNQVETILKKNAAKAATL